jgi:hypothetical protein
MGKPLEIVAGTLVLVGIILAFFYLQIGGALVGAGFGLYFFDEIRLYFLKVRGFYSMDGLFRTLMLLGLLLYLLLAIPLFLLATLLATVLMTLVYRRG